MRPRNQGIARAAVRSETTPGGRNGRRSGPSERTGNPVDPVVGQTLDQMGQSPRDQVVMVRVDAETASKLDAWVETGASRSEAAALFIREGLQWLAKELSELQDAVDDVE